MATRLATRVLIADDHLAVREGLLSLFEPDPAFEVVGAAADGNEASRMALDLKPDLVVLDNSMPGMTGLEVARMLHANLPQTKVIFFTLDPELRERALATGAVAHVSKSAPPDEIMRAVRAAAGLSPTIERSAAHAVRSEPAIGKVLMAEGLLSFRQLEDLERARDPRQTLANAVLGAGLVPEDRLAKVLARASGKRVVTLPKALDASVIKQLPRRFCELRSCVLIEFSRTSATLAIADPLDSASIAEAKDMLGGIELRVVTTTQGEVRKALRRAYNSALMPLFTTAAPPPTAGPAAQPRVPMAAQPRRPRRRYALGAGIAAALLLVASAVGLVLRPASAGAVEARANLTIFQGMVDVRHGAGPYATAASNELIAQGDTVRTAMNTSAALTFFEHSVVVLQPDTAAQLVTLRAVLGDRDIEVVMRQVSGETWHLVAHTIGA